jgi:hypothetical protein
MLKPNLISDNSCTVARIGKAVKAILPFKAWVAWFFSGLYAAEESLKGFVQTTHACLITAEIEASKVGMIARSSVRKP